MGEVVDVAHGEAELLVPTQVEEAPSAVVDRPPGCGETGLLLGVAGQQVGTAGPAGQQQPSLLEGLAHHGHPVRQAAGLEAEQGAGVGVAPPGAQRLGLGPPVERIDGAAGEDVGPAHEVRAQVAPHHQDLKTAGAGAGCSVAHQHDGGSRAYGDLLGWGRGRWRHATEAIGREGRRPRDGGDPLLP